ncbi:very short patch repair endonuclease [Mesorhizobium sp. M0482]|uniref:very short patch repair endonuclease n=1 Tax=Mesorhizobium sp. M0482 TaxID=2956948 RepID=UPI0033378079
MDRITAAERSVLMTTIRAKGTKPEMVVRRLAHKMGYRFRLHRKDLPGSPDLVFPSRRAVVFVHGCFWHQHPCCRKSQLPTSRQEFWHPKLARNVERDLATVSALRAMGWRVSIVWECEVNNAERLRERLATFLEEVASCSS